MQSKIKAEVDFENIDYAFLTKNIPGSSFKYNANAIEVATNHKLALEVFGHKASKVNILKQIHSNVAVYIEKDINFDEVVQGDALVTDKKGLVIAVVTADCVPVLFADKSKKIIGAVHAGNKGAFSGIIENCLDLMYEKGARDITAIIGPCIKQNSYEVGPEYYENFTRNHLENREFFKPSFKVGYYFFDLTNYVKSKLVKKGVVSIYDVNLDTYTNDDLFFSYRRNVHEGKTAALSNLSMILIK